MSQIRNHLDGLKATIANASDCYGVWWVLKGSDTRPKYNDVLNKYPGFFLANIHAQFVAYVVALYRPLETRKQNKRGRARIIFYNRLELRLNCPRNNSNNSSLEPLFDPSFTTTKG